MSSHLITTKSHLTALEGWRGIVSIMVLLFHFYYFFAPAPFVPWAFLGVDFFFILSGFIIARQYELAIGSREVSFLQFLIRRGTRLYPLYVFSIGLFLVINHFYIEKTEIRDSAIAIGMGPTLIWQLTVQATMLGNALGMPAPWNGPAWSVSVEWIVNLLFFFFTWKLRRIPTLMWICVIGFCTMYLIDHSPKTLHLIIAEPAFFNPTIARGLLGFGIGALIYRFHHSLPRISSFTLHLADVILVAAILTLIGYYNDQFVISIDYVMVFFVFPPLIIISLYKNSWVGRVTSLFPFTYLGKISYSMYLLHVPLGYFYQFSPLFQNLNLGKPLYGLGFVVLVIGCSTLTYLFLETPARVLGRRISRDV